MSHVVSSKGLITDLDCLEAVLAKHFPRMKLIRNQKTYKWYGQWVKDYHGSDAAYKNGIDPKSFGKCEHAIKLEGCGYEIGLVKVEGKDGYTAIWDFWGEGRKLSDAMGTGAERLMVAYGQEFCQRFAESVGSTASTEIDNNEELLVEIDV